MQTDGKFVNFTIQFTATAALWIFLIKIHKSNSTNSAIPYQLQ